MAEEDKKFSKELVGKTGSIIDEINSVLEQE